VILLNNTLTFRDVLLGNITFFIFAVFDVQLIYSVSQKTSPTFLAVTRESIVGFS